ncbi:MAG TPA: hypothetical protein VI461_13550 [Chitinophagaceae bacterium]|nr:hypothetical protein [Chitinophagaceae bacterium]
MVNEQQNKGERTRHKGECTKCRTEDLIDSYGSLVRHKVNSIACKMKWERFADIYLHK